jgi:hypothetical protein
MTVPRPASQRAELRVERLRALPDGALTPGLHEALLTKRIEALLAHLDSTLEAQLGNLANAEASDRVSRHLAAVITRAIEAAPENERSAHATKLALELLQRLDVMTGGELGIGVDEPLDPASVLHAVLRLLPDGQPELIQRPLTPLLDTTVLTNAPGEPAVGHELKAEIPSADEVDVVVAFIRWTGVLPLLDALHRHCQLGKRLRILTTTYTEQHRTARPRRIGGAWG